MIRWQEEQLKRKTWDVERSPQHTEEQHEEEHSEEEVVDDGGKDVDDNFEFVGENESDEDDDDDNDAILDDDIDNLKLRTGSTLPPLIARLPARIVLSERLKSWMSIFVRVMRAHVTTRTDGPVFLSWNGNAMKSGRITKAVQSVFNKAGLDVKITSTYFRKAAVTKANIDKPDTSRKLADLMAHNEATAKKYYLLSEKTSVEVSKNLGRLM